MGRVARGLRRADPRAGRADAAVRRIVVVTQVVDASHPALGATVPKLNALAERVDELAVLALRGTADGLPGNCRLRLFGAGTKLGRAARFEAALAPELRRRPERLLAHMAPIYAVLAAPPARALGGRTLTDEERRHREQLERLARELGAPVELGGPVPRAEVPGLLARADLLVNNMRAGAPDKVVYEAAATCLPVLASNPVLDDLIDPFPREDAGELARRLRAFAAFGAQERAVIGRSLRGQVAVRHSVESWADGVLSAVSST